LREPSKTLAKRKRTTRKKTETVAHKQERKVLDEEKKKEGKHRKEESRVLLNTDPRGWERTRKGSPICRRKGLKDELSFRKIQKHRFEARGTPRFQEKKGGREGGKSILYWKKKRISKKRPGTWWRRPGEKREGFQGEKKRKRRFT